ncbi:Hypothetical predicted protein [Paramuricea clavata]|uniref:Uncharacterized protein n=1 Tax=Paramuricea clavata TaxID=317549 RepID=A0A6S7FRE8_PARCT|nr:Hypothetical predicted protein [Paramuricea clavata]
MTDETVTPVFQKPRHVPYNLAAKAEEKIAYLLNQDIIEKVPDDETRTWVSPTVIAPKPSSDQIRLCVDMSIVSCDVSSNDRNTKDINDACGVVFKSRSLSPPESNYSTTEREALAIRWGIKKLRKYLLGAQQFKVTTDYKPLQAMFNKTAGDLPPRIEKFIMYVREYEYVAEYHPGKTNIADYLSSHTRTYAISSSFQAADEFARTVVQAERVTLINSHAAVTIQEIREETRKNTTLTKLIHTIQTGLNEADEKFLPYMAEVKHDLHIIDGVIYRGKRLIVPETLQRRVIALGHEGHQGISKTKSFIRQSCWFPGLDAKVERQIKECLACRATQPSRYHEPIKVSELPKGPW